jgi:hypothetical protein
MFHKKKRDVIKKVIAYMTLGIDVSRLFSDMVMASQTQDLVQKKRICGGTFGLSLGPPILLHSGHCWLT